MSTKTFIPAFSARSFRYVATRKSSHLWYLSVEVPAALVAHIQEHITQVYRHYTLMPGVSCTRLPASYTQRYFAQEIERDTKDFLLSHFLHEGAQHYLDEHRISIVNWPRLVTVEANSQHNVVFTFALSMAPDIDVSSWNDLTFIAPKRKNYTDLDTQVASFVQYLNNIQPSKHVTTIESGDWVRFSAQLTVPRTGAVLHEPVEYWLHITAPHANTTCMQVFLGAQLGDVLTLPASALLELEPDGTKTDYTFTVTIQHIMKTNHLALSDIQQSLMAPTEQLLHDKLIEVFSYRNDISLRRSIIEELFYALFTNYRFEIAPHAITRRKELLLRLMQNNPDTQVYAKQKQFLPHLTLLAETKLKEEAIIDAIAQEEKTTVDEHDIAAYLALQTHDRLKEFVYFTPLTDEMITSHQPCHEDILIQTVRREKTLNLAIERLTL